MIAVLLLGALILFAAAFAVLAYGFFWYEIANGPYLQELTRRSGGKPERWIRRGILSATASQFAVYLTYPLGFSRRYRETRPDPDCPLPPVLLLHGLYHNSSIWVRYRRLLLAAGFKNLKLWNYSSRRHTFHQLEDRLKNRVHKLSERFGGQPVILIGHSTGGLLSRAVAGDPATAERIKAVVTLAAPHHGSKASVLGMGPLVRELRYRGPLIEVLEAHPAPIGLPCLSVYTPIDNSVLPPSATRIDRPNWRELESAPVSHVSLVYQRHTANEVCGFLLGVCKRAEAVEKPSE